MNHGRTVTRRISSPHFAVAHVGNVADLTLLPHSERHEFATPEVCHANLRFPQRDRCYPGIACSMYDITVYVDITM